MDSASEKSSRSRRALRVALKAAKWLAIFSGVALLLVVLINLRDEGLSPEAKALAQFDRHAVPDAQNAYLALVGFDAPAGTDPIIAGAKIVADHEVDARDDPWGKARSAKLVNAKPAGPGDGRLLFVGEQAMLCDPIEQPCLAVALAVGEQLPAMMTANQELVSRYLVLQKLPTFANTSVPDPLQPAPSGSWGPARRLLATQAAVDGQSGHVDQALAFLAADMAVWRRILGSGGSLIDEMIGVRMLATNLALLSELIASPSFDAARYQPKLRELLAPLSPAERNASDVFAREFALGAKLLDGYRGDIVESESIGWTNRYLTALFFNKSATLNDSAKSFRELQKLASNSPADFAASRDAFIGKESALLDPGPTWIYNPIGKVFAHLGPSTYVDFIARVFDVAAYFQLVRAQLEVRLANLPSEGVPPFLADAGPETRNPYTDKPFAWNETTRSLSFEPMNPRPWKNWQFKAVVPTNSRVDAK